MPTLRIEAETNLDIEDLANGVHDILTKIRLHQLELKDHLGGDKSIKVDYLGIFLEFTEFPKELNLVDRWDAMLI